MTKANIIILALAAVIVYLIVTRPSPDPPDLSPYERRIDSLNQRIDSLQQVRDALTEELKRDTQKAKEVIRKKDLRIARLNQLLHEAENISNLPVPDVDSIVRHLYGPDAIPAH